MLAYKIKAPISNIFLMYAVSFGKAYSRLNSLLHQLHELGEHQPIDLCCEKMIVAVESLPRLQAKTDVSAGVDDDGQGTDAPQFIEDWLKPLLKKEAFLTLLRERREKTTCISPT